MRKLIDFVRTAYQAFIRNVSDAQTALIAIAFGTTLVSFIFGAALSTELSSGKVSAKFLFLIVILPGFSVISIFFVQTVLSRHESLVRERKSRAESTFLAALDESVSSTPAKSQFLANLLAKWHRDMDSLRQGKLTIHDTYWDVCSDLFRLAKNAVECTSAVPIEFWDSESSKWNPELDNYKRFQQRELIGKGISVRRTFVFESFKKEDADEIEVDWEPFLKIALEHLKSNFAVYYLFLDEAGTHKHDLSYDLALIDTDVLMVGRTSSINTGVFYYDFYELTPATIQSESFKPTLNGVLSNYEQMLSNRAKAALRIQEHRKRIESFPALKEKAYAVDCEAIKSAAQQVSWPKSN